MYLLRRIKLLYLFEDTEKFSEKEIFFFSLFNNLIESNQHGYYCLTGVNMLFNFKYNPKNNTFWFSINDIGDKFHKRYNMGTQDTSKFIASVLEKHLNFKNVEVTIYMNDLK